MTRHYIKRAAGPYSPWAKFDGPEDIAIAKGFVRRGEHRKYKGRLTGDPIAEIDQHLMEHPVCQAVDQILSTFGRETNDRLELLATVDFAAVDLSAAGEPITAETVEKVIAANKDWAPKLDRVIFSRANLKRALARLEQMFPKFCGEAG